jgi:hypothetical protein
LVNYNGYYLDEWGFSVTSLVLVKRSVVVYVVTDIVALFVVPKLPSTTIVHHVVSWILCFLIMAIDMPTSNVIQKIGLYGSWSTISFLVNFYLAMRVLSDAKWTDYLALAALATYVVCCAGNWFWHLCWFLDFARRGELSVAMVLYVASLAPVVRDDIVLMTWLWNKNVAPPENIKQRKRE